MARSTWISRRIGIGLIAATLALGGLLYQPAETLAKMHLEDITLAAGKMHLEDISLG